MNYLDAHTHVHFSAFDPDREEVMKRAKAAEVKVITVGTQISTSEAAIKFAKDYPEDAWATVGFHPSHMNNREYWHHDKNEQEHPEPELFDPQKLKELAKDKKVVAIGECGLDYFRASDEDTKKRQAEAFVEQINIAREVGKPLMIHCRDAFPDLIKILKEKGQGLKPGIVHFFTGTTEDAKALLELGYSFTFGGVVTFARSYDEQIKLIGSDRILSETDAPYVAPEPYRGKRNEPAYVVHTVKKLSEILGLDEEEMKSKIWGNAEKIFGKL